MVRACSLPLSTSEKAQAERTGVHGPFLRGYRLLRRAFHGAFFRGQADMHATRPAGEFHDLVTIGANREQVGADYKRPFRVIRHALILLLLASPVAAQDVPQKLALGSYLTSAFFDASITSFCSGAQTCHEQNPLLKPIVERRGVVAAMTVKGAMHAGITLGLLRLSKTHSKRTFWITVGLTAAQVAVDVANVRTLRK